MWILTGKLTIDFYNNDSVRLKRKNIEDLQKDLKKKYEISFLEVDEFDDPEKCVLGFSCVTPSNWSQGKAKTFMNQILETIDDIAFGRIISDSLEIYSLD